MAIFCNHCTGYLLRSTSGCRCPHCERKLTDEDKKFKRVTHEINLKRMILDSLKESGLDFKDTQYRILHIEINEDMTTLVTHGIIHDGDDKQ